MTDGSIPDVPRVEQGVARPQWSVMIPTHHCADLLAPTLRSVLSQAPGPETMQVEVVDDCSTADRPEDVVATVGRGRVDFFRQPRNLGIAGNFTSCLQRARGHYVHLLHGDDLVYPGLYERAGELLDRHPEVDAVVVGSEDVDETGAVVRPTIPLRPYRQIMDDFEHRIFSWNPLRAPAVIARRYVYEELGGFHPGLRYCADWDMWKRLAIRFTLLYEPDVFVGYRVHSRSDTARLGHSARQLREMIDSVLIGHHYLPDGRTRGWTREFYSTTRRWAWEMLRGGSLRAGEAPAYGMIIVESVVRQHGDRLLARAGRGKQS